MNILADMYGLTDVPYIGTLGLVCVVTILSYVIFKRNTTIFSSQGIPGPRPFPLVGNLPEMRRLGLKHYEVWSKKYGKVYGVFIGAFPVLFVNDLDILRQITVKEFNNFTDRVTDIGGSEDTIGKGVFFLGGSDWKRVRNIITPAFSSGKIKLMFGMMNERAIKLTENLMDTAGNDGYVIMGDAFGAFTIDVIAATAFGLDIDSQRNPDDPFYKICKKLFGRLKIENPLFLVLLTFPFLIKIMVKLSG
ncbi:hypothetical protein ScPMuIL_003822 [Solemya velum]